VTAAGRLLFVGVVLLLAAAAAGLAAGSQVLAAYWLGCATVVILLGVMEWWNSR
jgi:cytochrome c biogenesis protein CcdA